SSRQPYQERGVMRVSEEKRQRLIRHHVRRLGRLGIAVSSFRIDPADKLCKGRRCKSPKPNPSADASLSDRLFSEETAMCGHTRGHENGRERRVLGAALSERR